MNKEEAIKIVRNHYPANNQMLNEALEFLIPELKESEDERMRKIISDILLIDNDEIREILDANNVLMQDVYAWLEKQGQTFTKKDVDDAWLKGMCDAKHELEKQGEQTSSQTNERAWLHLVSDVLTWKDGIGQYLDDPRVQELAKKLRSEYAQKLYNSVQDAPYDRQP